MMIRTSQGLKTPAQALDILREARLSNGDLLGIFRGLFRLPEAKLAMEYILQHPAHYDEKLRRLAQENYTGRPIGAKTIHNIDDVYRMLQQCGLRAEIRITLHEERTQSIRYILALKNLEISADDKTKLLCVAMSGNWDRVSRTLPATLTLANGPDRQAATLAFIEVAEKIEIVSVLQERIMAYSAPTPLSDEVKEMLSGNQILFFDRDLFVSVCTDLSFGKQAELAKGLPNEAAMEELLMLFRNNSSREEFLEIYIERLIAMFAEPF